MYSHRRLIGVYCLIVLLMTGLIYRIYYINMSDYIAMAADVQGQYLLKISSTRGMIYDRNLQGLVNQDHRYVAAVMPSPQSAAKLVDMVEDEEERAALMEQLTGATPFAMEVEDGNLYAQGVDIFRVPIRYGQTQYAPHLIGYLSGDESTGAAGIEKAYDQWLAARGEEIEIRYRVDANGRALTGAGASVSREGDGAQGGVVLTLDSGIQLLTQNALKGVEKGAAVVLDTISGDILAMASVPAFDQNNIAASLDSEDAPFINRATSGYNIGSVFKLLVCAAALESGISPSYTHVCEGGQEVEGRMFRCNNSAVHGEVDMQKALQVSCNAYFINLAQQMEPELLLTLASNMGLGSSTELADGLLTQAGNLPNPGELTSAQAYANFSFGQGSSLASPLQMAQMVAAFANGGQVVTPRLVRGLSEEGTALDEPAQIYAANQVIRESTASTLRQLMIGVVEEGSGRTAKPLQGSAGGKTSSAQTGLYQGEDEIVHAWFAGFYPAQEPQYAIVVFVEGGESGEQVAAPIFKQIADGISGSTGRAVLGYSR